MAIRLPIESESSCDCRGFAVSSGTANVIRRGGGSFADHTFVHYYLCEDTRSDNTAKNLFNYGGADDDSVVGIVFRVNAAGPRIRCTLAIGNSGSTPTNPWNLDASPAALPSGKVLTLVISVTASTNIYVGRLYMDGVLIGTASQYAGQTPTLATLFNYTADGFMLGRTGYQNAVGVHAHYLLSGALSTAQADSLAAQAWDGPAALFGSSILFCPGVFTVEGTTSGPGARPEVPCTTANLVVLDANAASDPTLLSVNRAPATLTANVVQFVDPFRAAGTPPAAPSLTLSGAPSGWSVGAPTLRTSPQLIELHRVWRTNSPSRRQRVAILANSRTSYPTAARLSLPGSGTLTSRSLPGNFVDHDFTAEFWRTLRGRQNFPPPLLGDTPNKIADKDAWAFSCIQNDPLTTGSNPVDLSDTTASRFGTGSRVAVGPASPTYHGPGDPIRIPANSSYRLLAQPEVGLSTTDACRVTALVFNYPNSSQIAVRAEAAKDLQNGADVLSASNETGMPTLGTSMTAATFTGFNATTNTFTGVSDITGAQVGDVLEVCDASGNTISDVELSVITSATGTTIVVDGKFKIGSTIAGAPSSYRLKWCAPAIYEVGVSHAGGVTNANWRGINLTADNSRGGLIVLAFGVSNTSRVGPEIMGFGWSGRGWMQQYDQMSTVVSARDGLSLQAKLFGLLDPDLLLFSVADQGNTPVSSFPTYITRYVDAIAQAAPGVEIVMAGEGAHCSAETIAGLADGPSYANHQAAMSLVASQRGYTFLSLMSDASGSRELPGSGASQYLRGVCLDGTAHQFRGTIRGWMEQTGRLQASALAVAQVLAVPRTRRGR